ncbi:undecaprenyl-diphosphate phosphatase [Patescibacteria group bacterium]|nr:MAG: undecaprenyl-diphosphate phosphatase [Patescibacteria group bacterium]
MTIFDSIILGIVEGITEFLPISSTGHLILSADLLRLGQSGFLKSFEISIQLGAILSVAVLYWRRFLLDWESLKRVGIAFVPTGVVGFFLYKTVKVYLGSNEIVLWSMLLGGILLIAFELFHRESPRAAQDIDQISYKQAVAIGFFQCIAMIPGVSRSAATILGGLLVGISRKVIVEFSFLLAVVTMAAATGYDLLKSADAFSTDQFGVLAAGFVTSFLVAMVSIKWLLKYIKLHSFIPFGIYRVLAAVVFWFFLIR